MRLLNLQIKGFKSFAHDTIVHFNENVTGIVGPNGAGKSNIIDAIRWVLGEQKSKELRLEKMQDVIFNGTSKRKPANTAEVSITFENSRGILPSDYNIVKVSRVLYRSGESEYRLNDVVARLKDIRNLFIDTGIGSNSYAIIELGMVDDILQDKDHARRRMFEQAAGVSKYKKRKKETLSKLNLTQTDLDRVQDLLHEISTNLKSLEQQARRAKKYLAVKASYKEASLMYHYVTINDLQDQRLAISKSVIKLEHDYRDVRASTDLLEAKLQKEKLKNINDEKQLTLFQQKINSLTDVIRKKENRKEILDNELSHADSRIQGLKERISRNMQKITEVEGQLKIQLKRIDDEQKKSLSINSELEEKESIHQKVQSEYNISKAREQEQERLKQETEQKLLSVEKELAISQNKVKQAEHTVEHLINKELDLNELAKSDQTSLDDFNEKLEHESLRLKELLESEEQRHDKLKSITERISDLENSKRDILRKKDKNSNEINLLESMINKLDGFPESMKYLKNKWKAKQVILSDIIDCEEKYRPAVEAYLADYLDYYIVQDETDVTEAIQLLKSEKRGKAHFLIMNRVNVALSSEVEPSKEMIALFDVLKIDSTYHDLLKELCWNAFIVHSLPLEEDVSPDARLVTFDGSQMNHMNRIVGGSAGIFDSNKIGRKQKLAQLQKNVKQIEKQFDQIIADIQKQKELHLLLSKEDHRVSIKSTRQVIDELQKSIYQFTARIDNQRVLKENYLSDIAQHKQTIKDNTKLLQELELNKTNLSQQLIDIKGGDEIISDASSIAERLSQASMARNESQIEQIKQQNIVETLQKETEYLQEKLDETTADINAAEHARQNELKKKQANEKEVHSIKLELADHYQKRKEETQDLGGIEKAYFEAKQQITAAEDELRKQNKKVNSLQSEINSANDKSADLNYKIDGIKQRVQIEFGESINKLDLEITENYNASEESIKIEKLKSRLANYGEVNPMAVEAYDEMVNRKTSIEMQRDDILDAKKQLADTIKEIENTATKKFLESFEAARKHFKTVFRSLFTKDDTCDLILLDPEDPLTSEIEIIAKPKGKRPQSLSQLSGGEKTLTASALLFALYLLKPAPFCIFDEVDAPLDDHNVQKFTNIIRAFSQDSQFLVVTHNKATMAELDVLYGVYMEEKGISSVSAVDFRQYNHERTLSTAVG